MSNFPAQHSAFSIQRFLYAWLIVALLFFVAILNYLDRLMITTMIKPIQGEFRIDNGQVGLFTSVFLWVYASVSPLGGYLADRFGRRWMIVGSLFFWSLATCISGYAHSFHELLFARGLMGISEACYMPAALAMIADYHRQRTRSLATGVHYVGIGLGALLGGAGGYLALYFGWRFGFRLFGIVGLAYGVVLALALRDHRPGSIGAPADRAPRPGEATTNPTEKDPQAAGWVYSPTIVDSDGDAKTVGEYAHPTNSGTYLAQARDGTVSPAHSPFLNAMAALLASPGFRMLFAVNVLVGIINWSLYGWLPTYFQERFASAIGEAKAGLFATAFNQGGSFGGVLLGGLLADWWIRSNRRARALVPAIAFCVGGPCLMAVGTSGLLPVVILALIAVGVARGSFDANHMPALRDLIDERYSATGFGILNFISTAMGGVMVYASGMLQDVHASNPDGTPIKHANVNTLAHVFQVCGFAMLLGGILLLLIRFPRGSPTVRLD